MNSFAPELEAARMARPPVKDDDASAGPPPEPAPTSSPAPGPRPEWLEETVVAGRAAARWLGQPRPRTALVGVALLLIGAVIAAGSVWTLPLVIVGVAMIVVAWIGRRLGGHVGVTWGEHGAEIAVQARIQPAAEQDAPARPAIAASTATAASSPMTISISCIASRRLPRAGRFRPPAAVPHPSSAWVPATGQATGHRRRRPPARSVPASGRCAGRRPSPRAPRRWSVPTPAA